MALNEMIQPEYIRLTHSDGSFFCMFDPRRGIAMSVKRGGTAFFDFAEIINAWQRAQDAQDGDTIDATAISP